MNIDKIVIASHNEGKVSEIRHLLQCFGVEVVSAKELGLPEPIEDGETFVENAMIKAKSAVKESGLPSLADDSGLEVAAMQGKPGIHSARFAKDLGGFDEAMDNICGVVKNSHNKDACFKCVLTLAFPNGEVYNFEGRVDGIINDIPKGAEGFGYDAIFIPIIDGVLQDKTFAEIPPEYKHSISHRNDAFVKLCDWFASYNK